MSATLKTELDGHLLINLNRMFLNSSIIWKINCLRDHMYSLLVSSMEEFYMIICMIKYTLLASHMKLFMTSWFALRLPLVTDG